MKKISVIVLGSLLMIFFFNSCRKTDKFSIIPNVSFREFIQYKNIAGKDTAIDFVINFQDGDGDLGYSENEYFKCGVPQNNLFIFYEEKIGNSYVPKKFLEKIYDIDQNCDTIGERDDSLQLSFSSRMTNIQPRGSDKSIEGTVSYNLSKNNILFLSPKGRVRFYIIDRAGHQSNIEYSAELSIVK